MNQKYGKVENNELVVSDIPQPGYKPVFYAVIPDFDQTTQYVIQNDPIESADEISVDITLLQLPPNTDEGFFYESNL